jgi:hypothetical protein
MKVQQFAYLSPFVPHVKAAGGTVFWGMYIGRHPHGLYAGDDQLPQLVKVYTGRINFAYKRPGLVWIGAYGGKKLGHHMQAGVACNVNIWFGSGYFHHREFCFWDFQGDSS